jgi:hypothetical protein
VLCAQLSLSAAALDTSTAGTDYLYTACITHDVHCCCTHGTTARKSGVPEVWPH